MHKAREKDDLMISVVRQLSGNADTQTIERIKQQAQEEGYQIGYNEAIEKEKQDLWGIACKIPLHTIIRIIEEPTEEYGLKNNKTTYYICEGRSCKPPVNELNGIK